MKIATFLILVGCLQVSAAGNAQNVTLSFKDAPLNEIFAALERQTDFTFFSEYGLLQKAQKVTINVTDIPFKEALEQCLKNQPLTYSLIKNTVLIKPKKHPNSIDFRTEGQILIDIKGRVVDENGKPVPGVTVIIKGTEKQTITDNNGEFTFSNIDPRSIIVFSSVNMETIEINVGGQSEILAKLKTKTSQLDEVQIIAYGQTTKRLQTGNVSKIKGADIVNQPVSNALLALAGRVPGVFITQSTGMAGGGVTIRIQGQTSLLNGSDPLYIVDGVPITSQLPATGADGILGQGSSGGRLNGNFYGTGNPLNYLNPSDIESIEVLKDADATAIYGSRAANGALLITTKKGKVGKLRFDIDVQHGWGQITRKVDMLNSREYLDMRYEALNNDGINLASLPLNNRTYDLKLWDTTRFTDWQKVLIGGTANYSNISATVSGGNSNIQYLIGGTWRKETSVFPGNFADKKGSMHFNINSASNDQRFRVQFSGSYLVDNNRLPNNDFTKNAILLEPVAPQIYNEDGSLNWALNPSNNLSSFDNPYQYLYNIYENRTTNLISNLVVNYRILPWLDVLSNFGYTNLQTDDLRATPLISINPNLLLSGFQRSANFGKRNINSWIIEPQLKIQKVISHGNLDFLIGTTFQRNHNSGNAIYAEGFRNDWVLEDINSAGTIRPNGSYISEYKYSAVFSRINYNWQNKYIINLTGRRDGSSRFGAKSRFQNFGSIGGAWIISEESFFKNKMQFLSFGKLRGVTEQQQAIKLVITYL